MLDISNISLNFNKYKNIIIDLFVEYYGDGYRQLIEERINKTWFYFGSNPKVEWEYAKEHQELVTDFDSITKEYFTYNKTEEKAYQKYSVKLFKYIMHELNIKKTKINYPSEAFLRVFFDRNFDLGYIDSLSYTSIANYDEAPKSMQEALEHDRECVYECARACNIDSSLFTPEFVDNLNKYRMQIKQEYQEYIVRKSKYAKNLENMLINNYHYPIETADIKHLMFLTEQNSYNMTKSINGNYYTLILVQVVALKQSGVNYIDLSLIHELIHAVERNLGCTGLDIDDKYTLFNESRVQKLAIKLTTILHENGIFIYDDPNNYVNHTTNVVYEWLFPFIDDLLDKYESFISECAINSDIVSFENRFGESCTLYGEIITKAYDEIILTLNASCAYHKYLSDTKELIKLMEDNYNNSSINYKKK